MSKIKGIIQKLSKRYFGQFKEAEVGVTEYLYVDEPRLDAYVQQIRSMVVYEKVPVWRVSVGMLGPRAEVTREKTARPLTRHEKTRVLLKHLNKSSILSQRRPCQDDLPAPKPFVIESCKAVRFFIPPRPLYGNHFKGLGVWVSLATEEERYTTGKGDLVLLEDFGKEDESPKYSILSAYSSFLSLVLEVFGDIKQHITVDAPDQIKPLYEHATDVLAYIHDRPFHALELLGCGLGIDRTIQVLYRIREFGEVAMPEGKYKMNVFGYPIFICEQELDSQLHRPKHHDQDRTT